MIQQETNQGSKVNARLTEHLQFSSHHLYCVLSNQLCRNCVNLIALCFTLCFTSVTLCFRAVWQIFMTIVLMMWLTYVPYMYSMFAYGVGETNFTSFSLNIQLLTALQLLGFFDIVMNFFTGYRVEMTKQVVLEPRLIAR